MNRRTLLTRLLTAAAALPLVGTRVPEAQASGLPSIKSANFIGFNQPANGVTVVTGNLTVSGNSVVRNGAGGSIVSWSSPPDSDNPIPTFEFMQQDCIARGCLLKFSPVAGSPATHLLVHVQDGQWTGFDYQGVSSSVWLAQVDQWRRQLHEQAGG